MKFRVLGCTFTGGSTLIWILKFQIFFDSKMINLLKLKIRARSKSWFHLWHSYLVSIRLLNVFQGFFNLINIAKILVFFIKSNHFTFKNSILEEKMVVFYWYFWIFDGRCLILSEIWKKKWCFNNWLFSTFLADIFADFSGTKNFYIENFVLNLFNVIDFLLF